jgi:hypothetical protein
MLTEQDEHSDALLQADKMYSPLYSSAVEQKGDPLGLETMELDTAKSTSSVPAPSLPMKQ